MSHDHSHGASASTREHRHEAEQIGAVPCAVIVISDSRTERTDRSGRTAAALIQAGGHEVIHEALIRNEAAEIRAAVGAAIDAGSRFVFCTGGTGLGDRDITVDTVTPMLEKVLGRLRGMVPTRQLGPDRRGLDHVARGGRKVPAGAGGVLPGFDGGG